MAALIVTGDIVVTMDPKRRVIRDGAVYIEDDTIVEVGTLDQLKSKYKVDRTFGGKKRLVLPGFVNTHDHYEETLMRQVGDDRDLTSWVEEIINPLLSSLEMSDITTGVRVCVAEQLRSGITTVFNDTVSWLPKKLNKKLVVESIRNAAEDVGGIRLVQAVGGLDHDSLGKRREMFQYDIDSCRRDCIDLIQKYNYENSNMKIWTAATSAVFCTPEMFETMKKIADEFNTGAYSHIAETLNEIQVIRRRTGKSEVQYYDKLGFLDKNVLLAHAVWIDDEDIKRLVRSGSSISHQPICNLYLSDGIAPIPEMIRCGVTVGLGMDDGGHTNEDFFSLMRAYTLLHKGVNLDSKSTTAEKALEMATIDGAKALGMANIIGSLEPGKRADIIVVNIESLNYAPHLRPIMALVYGGMESDIETTIVNGKVVVENGKLVAKVDVSNLLNEAELTAHDLCKRAGLHDIVTQSRRGWHYEN